jgi:glycosyltransferase involved in cell wall biosynthesis
MVAKPRILLVYFEGLAETVIDSVVLDHARQAARQSRFDFAIWTFCSSNKLYCDSKGRQLAAAQFAGCDVRVFRGIRPAVPFSTWLNALLFRWHLRGVPKPDVIHARADYSAAVCAFARRRRMGLLWDCRADVVAEAAERMTQWPRLPRWIKTLKVRNTVRIRRRAADACHAALFITNVLAELCRAEVSGKPTEIIPTAASEDLFFFDPDLREKARTSLGLQPRNRVFVYSGSLTKIQCFDEVVDRFAAIHESDPDARLLVLTPETPDAKRRVAQLDPESVLVRSASLQDLNAYLNGADVGFMLRQDTPANAASLPTKFAEYCLTGLPVIMTEAVPEACRLAANLGNWVRFDDSSQLAWPVDYDRIKVAHAAKLWLGKEHLMPLYESLYQKTLFSCAEKS